MYSDRIRDWWHRENKSLAAAIFVGAVLYILACYFDFTETWYRVTQSHEFLELDELLIFPVVVFLTALVFSSSRNKRLLEANFELAQEKAFSENILQGTPSIIIEMDAAGAISFVNPAALAITEYDRYELLGHNFWDVLMPDGGSGALKRHLAEGGSVDLALRNKDLREDFLIAKSGRKVLIAFTVLHRPVSGREMTVLIGSDITRERQHFEQQAALEKMRALGEMSGGMAHEINNALQPIVGLSEVIEELARGKDPQIEECIGVIHRSAMNARKIVSDVLAFGRKQDEHEMVVEKACDCLSEAVWFSEQLLPSTITVEKQGFDFLYEEDDDSYVIRINRVRLIQILTNIFSNSAHAMKSKGTLTVRYAQMRIDDGALLPSRLQPGRYVVLEITDEGCGMSAATLASAFEPFFTTKPVGEGTGLGLSIVYGIIKEWNGDLVIESTPGKGTTVRIFLPDAGPDESEEEQNMYQEAAS